MKTICLITNGHIASNPRIVKEADALCETGYRIVLISTQYLERLEVFDKDITDSRKWIHKRVVWSKRTQPLLYAKSYLMHYICSRMPAILWSYFFIAENGFSRITHEITQVAIREKADLYIAHNLGALPAAIAAAHKYKAKIGFDAEDFHSEELLNNPKRKAMIEFLENKYLPKCDYITAASQQIAQAYAQKYGISKLTAILNVFPLRFLQEGLRIQNPFISLYWFSQTIGHGRGLEEVIQAMGMFKKDVKLYLQGQVSLEYKASLIKYSKHNGVLENNLIFLDSVKPDDLFKIAAQYDVGLAVEQKEPLNRDLCVTNKIFTYLLAGLSIIATDTQGQRPIVESIGQAGWMYKNGDVKALAHRIKFLSENREELKKSKFEALNQAKNQYNWDFEKNKFLKIIKQMNN